MISGLKDLEKLRAQAEKAALTAAEHIRTYLPLNGQKPEKNMHIQHKNSEGSLSATIVTQVDVESQNIIENLLSHSCKEYDLAWLAEESKDDGSRFNKEYFWCVDPLDGTLPFSRMEPGCSVAIALIDKNGSPVISVVCDIWTNNIYTAIRGHGALKNSHPFKLNYNNVNNDIHLFMDLSIQNHPLYDDVLNYLRSKMQPASIEVHFGYGAILNALSALEQGPGAYFKFPRKGFGGGSVWDFAPSACIYNELGFSACNFYGEPLLFNPPESTHCYKNGVIYCTAEMVNNLLLRFGTEKYFE